MLEKLTSPSDAQSVAGRRVDRIYAVINSREKTILIAAVVFQVIVLLMLIVWRLVPLITGDTILLRVTPVDPRDLFRGDYVILSYGELTNSVAEELGSRFDGNWSGNAGKTVYVSLVLDEDGKHWKPTVASFDQPTEGKFIRGKFTSWFRVEFGIEAYFVEEGKGRELERAIRDKKVSAEIALTSSGVAALRGLKIEN